MNAPLPAPRIASVELLVRSVRASRFGALFYGIDETEQCYVVACAPELIPDSSYLETGQLWRVEGPVRIRETTLPTGFVKHETVVTAKKAGMTRPSGRRWIDWISESKECVGIWPAQGKVALGYVWSGSGALGRCA